MSTQKVFGDADFLGTITGAGGGGAAETWTTENLHFPMDPASSLEVPAGTIFTSQTEIDDFLTANAATHFKYVMDCFDALPHHIYHAVYFDLEPGIHRPRAVPRGEEAFAAWVLSDYPGQPRHHEFHTEGPAFISLTSLNYTDPFTQTHGPLTVTGFSNSGSDNYYDVSDTLTPGELRGHVIVNPNWSLPIMIRDNDANRIYFAGGVGGAVPATITIAEHTIIFRNSLDDVTYAVNKPMFLVRCDTFQDFGLRVVWDSMKFQQYAVSQVCINARGRIYHDTFLSICDQAELKDAGVDSRGNWLNHSRGGVQGQFWKCMWRGQKDAAVPTNNSQAPLFLNGDTSLQWGGGRFVMNDSVWRGCSNPIVAKAIKLNLNQSEFQNWSASAFQFTDVYIESGQTVFFRDFTSQVLYFNDGNVWERACYFDNCGDSSSPSDSLFYIVGKNNRFYFGTVLAGSTGNTAWTIYTASGQDNVFVLNSLFTDGAFSAAGDIWNADGNPLKFSEVEARRKAGRQPDGAMLGLVKVLQLSDGITYPGTKTLTYTSAGTTLQFDGGSAVNVSGLGVFLLPGTGGTWAVVVVAALPGSDQSYGVPISKDEIIDYRGNVFRKVS